LIASLTRAFEGNDESTNSRPRWLRPVRHTDRGRKGRIAQADRRDSLRYREASSRLERDSQGNAHELRSLLDVTRWLRDQIGDLRRESAQLRAELPAWVEAEIERILADQLPEIIDYLLARMEASRNGQAHHR
jgi:hypothetical protein